jgi:hypothetical protein
VWALREFPCRGPINCRLTVDFLGATSVAGCPTLGLGPWEALSLISRCRHQAHVARVARDNYRDMGVSGKLRA